MHKSKQFKLALVYAGESSDGLAKRFGCSGAMLRYLAYGHRTSPVYGPLLDQWIDRQLRHLKKALANGQAHNGKQEQAPTLASANCNKNSNRPD